MELRSLLPDPLFRHFYPLFYFSSMQPEAAGDVISGSVAEYVGLDVHVNVTPLLQQLATERTPITTRNPYKLVGSSARLRSLHEPQMPPFNEPP